MKLELRRRISITMGLVMLALLIGLTVVARPEPVNLLPGLLFGVLVLLTTTFGVQFVEGEVSLLPMTSVAAYLVMGAIPAAWVAFGAAVAHGLVRYVWAERLGSPQKPELSALAGLTAANATMHTASILGSGLLYQAVGGTTPLVAVDLAQVLPLLLLGLAYLGINTFLAGTYIVARSRALLWDYLRSLPNLLLFEGLPLFFAPLMALVYTLLGLGQFILFAFILVATSLITRHLAHTSRRLERRVKELDSLQAVGQALSASLYVETVLEAIYDQVTRLMPARSFYVALYDPEADEVSFPLSIEGGERVQWRSRRTGNGLTEHILRTRAPLLIREDVQATVQALGLDHIGRPAACWLGVPLLAGEEPLGVMAAQSYAMPRAYDDSHQEVLVTIAAQAAAAIQNARLYARTDEALARRVQELGSILRTTHEGILLLDADWRVLAVNRALAGFVGIAQVEIEGKVVDAAWSGQAESPATLLGYAPGELRAECETMAQEEAWTRRQTIVLPGLPARHVERTLTPVHDREGRTRGWLLALRDVTEEVQLANLKEEMTHMLVHDMRSPLTVMKGSLDLLVLSRADGDPASFDKMLEMARRNNDQMLRLVNDLLDISKLEAGQQPVHPEVVAVRTLLEEAAARFTPLLASAQIEFEIEVEPDLPPLHVDPHLVGRVLNNLFDNAIKFTPDGGHIRLWARRDAGQGPGSVLIGVSDTGPGIPPEDQPRLFQKFQSIASHSGRRAGTGLGLPFCELAVKAHGGRIWVESETGQGSTFIMTLPVAERQPGTAVSN